MVKSSSASHLNIDDVNFELNCIAHRDNSHFDALSHEYQNTVEQKEFIALLNEIKEHNFRNSKELTEYIRKNRLGLKYKNIAGEVKMRNVDGREWTLSGGIAPSYFARLCRELRFNKSHNCEPTEFTPYKNLGEQEGTRTREKVNSQPKQKPSPRYAYSKRDTAYDDIVSILSEGRDPSEIWGK